MSERIEKTVFLFSAYYTKPDTIHLWGIDTEGNRVHFFDTHFHAYCYAIPSATISGEGVTGLEDVEIFLKAVKTTLTKITVDFPTRVESIKQDFKDAYFEANIWFVERYMIDRGMTLLRWVKIVCEYDKKHNGFDTFKIVSIENLPITPILPDLRMVAVDIETDNPSGVSYPDRNPVIIITIAYFDENGQLKVIKFILDKEGEGFQNFARMFRIIDPDIVFTYSTYDFDYPSKRASIRGYELNLGRDGTPPMTSEAGKMRIRGRLVIDLLPYAEQFIPTENEMHDLKQVARDFLDVEPIEIDKREIHNIWRHKERRQELAEYCASDSTVTLMIGKKVFPNIVVDCSIFAFVGERVNDVSHMAKAVRIIQQVSHKYGFVTPMSKLEKETDEEKFERRIKGGHVFKPEIGIHSDIYNFDYSQTYATLIQKYNIGFETFIPPEELHKYKSNDYYTIPFVGHHFKKSPRSVYSEVEEIFVKLRATFPKDSVMYERIKFYGNNMFGQFLMKFNPFYHRESAESITASGRDTLMTTADEATSEGMVVIYGDTDSIFTKLPKPDYDYNVFIDKLEKKVGMRIRLDHKFKRFLLLAQKKRYAGLEIDEKTGKERVVVKGFEHVRRDWCQMARRVQFEIFNRLLHDVHPIEVGKFVHDELVKLTDGKIPLSELRLSKSLSMLPHQYKNMQPHLKVALMQGLSGGRIYYFIGNDGDKIADKAIPESSVHTIEDIDVNYYIYNQVLPSALRILEVLGVGESFILYELVPESLDALL